MAIIETANFKNGNGSATALLENIRQGAFAFTGQNRQSDDKPMLALKGK